MFLKKYRQFNILEWVALLMMTIGFTIVYILLDYNIFVFVALLFFIDFIEIKALVKLDLSVWYIYPHSFTKLFKNAWISELLSFKLVALISSSVFLLFKGDFVEIFHLLELFFLQSFLTVFVYHLSYRFTSYSTIFRIIYFLPFAMLYFLKPVLERIMEDFYFYKHFAAILFILVPVLVRRITLIKPFPDYESIKKAKNNIWSI